MPSDIEEAMQKILFAALAYLSLTATAVWSQDAMDFYSRGLESSLANKRIEYFSKAIELNPNLAEAYEKRALHYYYQRKYDKAINDYSKLIEFKPLEAAAYMMRGSTYLRKGRGGWIKAKIDSLKSYFSKQGLPRSRELLDKAIEDLSQAIELDAKLASAYSYRAEAYRFMGMSKEALRDSTVAINLGGDSLSIASAHATRAKIYGQRGQHELAEAEFSKAMELNPRFYVFGFFLLRYFDDIPSLEAVHWWGLVGIIAVAFVLIFQVTLRRPQKGGR
jgi:tetratricopeptide (TPR) repeat protein